MKQFFVVSDLHGKQSRYRALFRQITLEKPDGLFIAGDILPHFARMTTGMDFLEDFLRPHFRELRKILGAAYPETYLILGNDDPRVEEEGLVAGEEEGLWHYMHNRSLSFGSCTIYGYANIPPTPFRLKDWERYDVSRYVDPGCISPTEGMRSVDTGEDHEYSTIAQDLTNLAGKEDLSRSIFLFHAPPYQTRLDRAALDGMMIDYVPLDVHIGSIAIKRFIEERQPLVTLHGHVHESTRLTGHWSEQIGSTWSFNAATDSPGLSLISFDPEDPAKAERRML